MTGFAEFDRYDALGLAELVRKKEVSPRDLLDEAIARLERVEPHLNAVPLRHDDHARAQIDKGLADGPFRGVPFLLKDITLLEGTETTFGSRAFKGAIADHSSTLVARHLAAGFAIFGKTASPEFGLTVTTEPVLYGPTRNPWNPAHSTGGSSGGAAAIVAARVLPLAHATDGGGSIRIPAACCGVFGLKPTRARTPVGPDRLEGWCGLTHGHAVSRTVRDSAALLDATQGPELGSPYEAPRPERPFLDEVGRDPGRLRIAFTDRHPNGSAIDPEVAAAVRETAQLLEKLGHHVDVRAPAISVDLGATMRTIVAANTAHTLRLRAQQLGRELGPDDLEAVTLVMRSIAGKESAVDYVAAANALHHVGQALAGFFESCDVLLTPTLCRPPLTLGTLDMMTTDITAYGELFASYAPGTAMFNMSGQPSMSVPLAWSPAGLPLGMMFSARYGDDATLFRLAAQLEREQPWANRRPPVCA